MPTYEYRCPEGHEFELFQRMSDEPRAQCPECGVESQRMLSAGAGFLFKGDGFYITDYRSDSYKKAAKADAAKKGGSASSKDGGSAPSGSGSPSSGAGSSSSPPSSSDSGKG
ncbi:MAG: zinc ribbon domain-containing protein [Gemmatimonadales bacterium]|nr:MAG: zinc ribbon domain-containing protein [Gemmatimonadales bacterium]